MPKEFGNAQDLVVIEDIKENTVILKSGSLRQVIMVSGVNFALKSEAEQNIITQAYQNFLNGLDFQLQILIHSRKVNIEKYLEKLEEFGSKETSPILQNQAGEYREFIRGFVQKNAVMEKTFLVVVPFFPLSLPSKGSIIKFIPFLNKGKNKEAEEKAREEAAANFAENQAQLKQRVSQVLEGLFAIGLEAVVLGDEQLIGLFYNFYNPESVEREKINLPTKQ